MEVATPSVSTIANPRITTKVEQLYRGDFASGVGQVADHRSLPTIYVPPTPGVHITLPAPAPPDCRPYTLLVPPEIW